MSATSKRRQRRAVRLHDAHAVGLMSMAHTLTSTYDRADRLVVDTIAAQSRRRGGWLRRRHEQRDMAGALHAGWLSTHAPRGERRHDDTSIRARVHELTDLQLGLVVLCLFGGYTYVRAGHTLSLSPAEAAGELRSALQSVGR